MGDNTLLEKIREGLVRSGFPLEMKIDSILQKQKWSSAVGRLYKDYETGKVREIDISASKTINGIQVHLKIACKKSTERQIVLYSPKNAKGYVESFLVKKFPLLDYSDKVETTYNIPQVQKAFDRLPVITEDQPVAFKLVVTKGDKITEENIKLMSDMNGLIKHAIVTSVQDGLISANFRLLYLFIVVYEGYIFLLTPSADQPFNLEPVEYGKLLYEMDQYFALTDNMDSDLTINNLVHQFSKYFLIEIMTPIHFEQYIIQLEKAVLDIPLSALENWGKPWPR